MLACVTSAGGLFPCDSFFPPYLPVSVRIWLRSQRYGALYLCNDMISSNLSSAAAISFGSDYNFVVIFLHLIHKKNCHKISLVAAPLLILVARGCVSLIFVKSFLLGIDFCFSGNTPSGNLILGRCQIAGMKWVSSVGARGALGYVKLCESLIKRFLVFFQKN